ncbi:MAG TPA: carboxypeptidase-like regulatory domain-containing protein [Gemmatimonadaceae bacterium]|nr:carboxypeptidase-like regulatory domain-containing protein [Gemmatimonadaceae bacterium]
MKIWIGAIALASSTMIGATSPHIGASTFRGRLVDAVTGKPIGAAMVTLEGGDSARTTSDGSFTIARVTPDVHVLWVRGAGYPDLRLPGLRAPAGGDLKLAIALRPVATAADAVGLFRNPPPLFVVEVRPDSEQVGYYNATFWPGNATGEDSIVSVDVAKGRAAADLFGPGAAGGAICITLKAAAGKPRSC